ncbi:MAG: tetratricopeptide repeat protein [Candidatus Synoicihabitans palmerolidicus]|nr:tetratricopeptide repeat protein [Candidatus Synoicihabitans palmerolidicus]
MPPFFRHFLSAALFLSAIAAVHAEDSTMSDLAAAQSLFEARRYVEAQPLFEAVLVNAPDDPTALLHLGKLAAKRRERELAVTYLQHALAIVPDDTEPNFEYGAACSFWAGELGTSFKALRQAHRGRKAMERAVELAPDNLVFRQGLRECHASAPGIAGGSMCARPTLKRTPSLAATRPRAHLPGPISIVMRVTTPPPSSPSTSFSKTPPTTTSPFSNSVAVPPTPASHCPADSLTCSTASNSPLPTRVPLRPMFGGKSA